jgi:2-polyprenyl-3-methyl-5-hydroxy-6-metoxy-1,4-benzoquinol methylase
LQTTGSYLTCNSGHHFPVIQRIPRFVQSDTHESFGIQWTLFGDVQLDSRNGTTLTRDRLLSQSGLTPEAFRNARVLEVGCGSGRFTEVLLGFGAQVVAVDYSSAIDACAGLNREGLMSGHLMLAQADVFALPVAPRAFDIVIGYGILQHTGDPRSALRALWERVAVGGLLLVDQYQLDVRHFLPFKYALRPFLRRMPRKRLLRVVEKTCDALIPLERWLLRRSSVNGWRRWIRYAVGRLPNATYPINLELNGVIGPEVARRWSVLETFDQYAPRYDRPCTANEWRKELAALSHADLVKVDSAGQGNVAVVRRP